jgi:hypothetical protein
VLEALACKQLGFPDETKLEAVRDRVLCRLLGTHEPLPREDLGKQMVRQAADARRADLAAVREAVLRDWLAGSTSQPTAANGQAREEHVEAEAFDLLAFAATVQAAARTCPTGWFGDNKVFISHVWKQLQAEPHLPVLHSLEEFKQRLGEANHQGLLHLSRADLVQAMDATDVQQSETHYLGAVFHFIRIEGGRP